ncbi:MAG: hypothetical protein KGK07_07310 [Chloroflexota bacterium]|nr:hypothetical protein [Chloroflexota bacterium]
MSSEMPEHSAVDFIESYATDMVRLHLRECAQPALTRAVIIDSMHSARALPLALLQEARSFIARSMTVAQPCADFVALLTRIDALLDGAHDAARTEGKR